MKKSTKNKISYIIAVIALTILMLNNIGQASILLGFNLNNTTINWIAVFSLIGSIYYMAFLK